MAVFVGGQHHKLSVHVATFFTCVGTNSGPYFTKWVCRNKFT